MNLLLQLNLLLQETGINGLLSPLVALIVTVLFLRLKLKTRHDVFEMQYWPEKYITKINYCLSVNTNLL